MDCPQSAEAHDKIAKCLQHSAVANVVTAGRELNSLRTIRNHADYRLNDKRFSDAGFVQLQLGVARTIHAALSEAAVDLSIRDAIRQYAATILKLPLRDVD